MIQGDTALFL